MGGNYNNEVQVTTETPREQVEERFVEAYDVLTDTLPEHGYSDITAASEDWYVTVKDEDDLTTVTLAYQGDVDERTERDVQRTIEDLAEYGESNLSLDTLLGEEETEPLDTVTLDRDSENHEYMTNL